jgi:hypothetical protein
MDVRARLDVMEKQNNNAAAGNRIFEHLAARQVTIPSELPRFELPYLQSFKRNAVYFRHTHIQMCCQPQELQVQGV